MNCRKGNSQGFVFSPDFAFFATLKNRLDEKTIADALRRIEKP